VINKEFADGFGGTHRVQTFADLDALFRAIFDGLESAGRSDMWRTHHIATIRKVRNRLVNISTRCAGLVTDSGDVSDHPYQTQFQAFFDALEQGKDMSLTSFADGFATHRVIAAADKSASEKRAVKISEIATGRSHLTRRARCVGSASST